MDILLDRVTYRPQRIVVRTSTHDVKLQHDGEGRKTQDTKGLYLPYMFTPQDAMCTWKQFMMRYSAFQTLS